MTARESNDDDAVERDRAADDDTGAGSSVADGDASSLTDRVEAFPWDGGVIAGALAFLAGYAVMGLYRLAGIAQLPGSLADQLTRLGFVLYNAHNVVIVGDAGPDATVPSYSLLALADQPLIYFAVPVVALLLASGAFTYWRDPQSLDAFAAVATGAGMALGYLAVALVGTYVFTLTQVTDGTEVLFHPSRVATLLYCFVYPMGLGVIGSIVVQAVTVQR